MTTVTGRMRANDSRSCDTKNSYHNLSQLDVALPRPSEPRKGECPTTRGRDDSLSLSVISRSGHTNRLEALIWSARRLRVPG